MSNIVMMGLRILYILTLLSITSLHAQKEYNIWYFGDKAGLNFNTIPPTVLNDSKMWTFESSTTICDENGQLLFYTNSDSVFNRKHQLMKNGQICLPGSHFSSSTQGSLALKVPNSSHLYYLFITPSSETYFLTQDSMLQYCIVDMNGDNGLGEITLGRQPLMQARYESMALTQHANRLDYWIVTTDGWQSSLNCIRTSEGQFTEPVIRHKINVQKIVYGVSQIKFSPDSRILYCKETGERFMNLYKFNNTTGQISEHLKIKIGDQLRYQGLGILEFSPDSRFIYISITEGSEYNLYQYDLTVWDSATIVQSRHLLHSSSPKFTTLPDFKGIQTFSNFQLGPDGKIYGFHMNYDYYKSKGDSLSVINFPNLKGTACDFKYKHIGLNNASNSRGGPYYPSCYFGTKKINFGRDTSICIGEEITLTYNSANGDKVKWNTGETTSSIVITHSGLYSIEVTLANGSVQYDTITVKHCEKTIYFIPNTFTPNNDSLNSVFRVSGTDIEYIKMELFNRWGELFFTSEGKDPYWDGTYNNEPCEDAVYFYKISIKGVYEDRPKQVIGCIRLMR